MEVIDKKVLIKEVVGASADLVFFVKNLPKKLLFQDDGALHSGIEISQTGDNGFVFFRASRQGLDQLETLDRYIEGVWPRTTRVPKRIPNQVIIGNAASPALTSIEMENRFADLYKMRFLDLKIPTDLEAPVINEKTVADEIADTYKNEDVFDPTAPQEKPVRQEVEKEVPPPLVKRFGTPVNCAECGFEAKNNQSLMMHIRHKHTSKKKEAATISSG